MNDNHISPKTIAESETLFKQSLERKILSLGEITAFKCIRLCFGELHTIDRKFENFVGQITNGEFNIIIEQMNWKFMQDDEILISDQMEAQEIGVLWGFVQTRKVKRIALSSSALNICLEDDIELIAERLPLDSSEREEDGLRWYLSKGEEWLLTYNEKENLVFEVLKTQQ